MKSRGVSPLIGFVLLIGIVAVASISLLVVGGEMMDTGQQQTEETLVKQSFVKLSNTIASMRESSDTASDATLNAGEQGAIAHHDSATYEIWAESYNSSNKMPIENGTIGTIEYKSDDGTKVAFEGGGVFSETGKETQVLSKPAISYDKEANTLSFSVTELTDERSLRSGDIYLNHVNSTGGEKTFVRDDHIFINRSCVALC
ncbi:hypothetical protein Natpe_1748 [Natrinema pellirubrum DSM 15624]|uniref:Flagellin n=1 Tax=Natrinema pellirubrum (strain DSM 15624 / CIP 106293 / JCM 10476 / NCIMB 786 / 157) TaxID=797303 RepID=L0JM18_NATP1|nr:hypothetical protein [Natrinema pellirubrum]AGB31637.1 hypothetical protein Natpe_1748 [Natrinema pellirubrum DSM 15624]